MIVTTENFDQVLEKLKGAKFLSVDVETTGLYPHKDDVLFSIIIATENGPRYFNFEDYNDGSPFLGPRHIESLKSLFTDPTKTWFAHNAKFDLAFLRKEGVEVLGTIHDTKTVARLLWNDHMKYSLKDCVKRDIGMEKSDVVEKYIMEHGLYEDQTPVHKNTKERKAYYHKVPFPVISEYGLIDGEITYRLGIFQRSLIDSDPSLKDVYNLECALIKPMLDMEHFGVKIDPDYCRHAIDHEEELQREAMIEFKRLTDRDFIDSNKLFSEVFDLEHIPKTDKGNPSFDKFSLAKIPDSPIAKMIIKYREAKSQANYFHGFLHHADDSNIIHPNFLADGTATGRFSSQNPNLQNLTKPDGSLTQVRAAFVPRPGFTFYIFDYKAQEYRLLVDQAGATDLAKKIIGGFDAHADTAEKAGVTRHEAKITLFSTIYGSGLENLSQQLGCSEEKAGKIRTSILRASPEISAYLSSTVNSARISKTARTWLGRQFQFPSHRLCYRAPNYKIQGGSADITKTAILLCDGFLIGAAVESRMVLTVHDSIVLEIAHGEEWILPILKEIMIKAYPYKILPMDVSVERGIRNMAETEKVEI